MNPQEYYDALVARFWSAFGSGALMPFDLECLKVVKGRRNDDDGDGVPDAALGYYDIVWGNIELFKTSPDQITRAERCCNMAGRIAASIAIKKGAEIIDPRAFRKACLKVEKIQLRALNQAIKNGTRSMASSRAGVCG